MSFLDNQDFIGGLTRSEINQWDLDKGNKLKERELSLDRKVSNDISSRFQGLNDFNDELDGLNIRRKETVFVVNQIKF